MATESPLLRHSQSTASTNMSNTASLSGPNGSGQFLIMSASGARTVAPASAGTSPYAGVLQNDPTSGFVADVGFVGVSKVVAGASFSAGNQLMSDANGRAILWTTGNYFIGIALEAATAANQVITALIYAPGSKA